MASSQSDRIDTILRELHEAENALRAASTNGPEPDGALHNDLANRIRNQIGEMSHGDLKSLALRMVVHDVNGSKWDRCDGCNRPTYLGEAKAPQYFGNAIA